MRKYYIKDIVFFVYILLFLDNIIITDFIIFILDIILFIKINCDLTVLLNL